MKYFMSDVRVLANAMIDISKRDERYIIDNQDIMDYTSALLNAFSQYHVDVDVSESCREHCDINRLQNINTDYFMPTGSNGKLLLNKGVQHIHSYILLPWVSRDDLIREYRSNYPLDSMFCLFERDNVNYMEDVPKRSIPEFASLEGNYQLALQSLLNRTNSQKQKAEETIKVYQKRIECIKNQIN